MTSVVRLPISAIREADSPRSAGVDMAHARALAQTEADLPPILVHRATMRVIDGMHRLAAARLRGEPEIAAVLFDGDDDEAFLLAVRSNVSHGLPLTLTDRRAAAVRIIRARPDLSDRTIAVTAGLAAKTVGSLRREIGVPPVQARIGQDGRVRPIDASAGRQAAAELIASHPEATLRRIARDAGISVETARSVRARIRAGEDPVLDRRTRPERADREANREMTVRLPEDDPSDELRSLLEVIQRDPSLRYTESGRVLLRFLGSRVLLPDEIPLSLGRIPPHSRLNLGSLARSCAAAWIQLAMGLEDDQAG
ncbi:ParB N-terminal domain-containing protein [Actinoplanes sp. NBRC 103695]|uniref:ParB/RepB/Spo0J family partition protein n=1 Tax=Actinoplanes sp. NBRC 103695 TaxID=3032202 RepID=UPI0025553DE2|nr:ParB N-terminal domain-containing protein [Actinoplanes sp. NBRC 103695]